MGDLNKVFQKLGEHDANINFLVEHAKSSDEKHAQILGAIAKLDKDNLKSKTTWVTVLKTSSAYVTVSGVLIGIYHNLFGG